MTNQIEMPSAGMPTSSSYIDSSDLLDEELWLSLTAATSAPPALPHMANAKGQVSTAPLEGLDAWMTFSPQATTDMAWHGAVTEAPITSPALTSVGTDAASVASTSSLSEAYKQTAPRGVAPATARPDSETGRSRSRVRTVAGSRGNRSTSSTSRTALSPVRDGVATDEAGGVGKTSRARSRPARRASIGPAAAAMMRVPASAPGSKQSASLRLDTAGATDAGVGTGPQTVPGIAIPASMPFGSMFPHQHPFAPGSPPVNGPALWPGPGSWPGPGDAMPAPWPMVAQHLPNCGSPYGQPGSAWPGAHPPLISPGIAPPSHPSQAMQGVFDGMSGLHMHHSPPIADSTGVVTAEQQGAMSPSTSSSSTRSPPSPKGGQLHLGRRNSKSASHGGGGRMLEDVPENRAAPGFHDGVIEDEPDEDDEAVDDVSMAILSSTQRTGRDSSSTSSAARARSRSSDTRAPTTTSERRARRRESHNLVERRRRDTINERIAELASLLPEAMLLDAIANSQSGGNASKVVKLPMPASAIPSKKGDEGGLLNVDDLASAPADSETLAAAQARPNKSIILRKSVDYIRALQDFIEHQRRQNADLLRQRDELMGVMMASAGQPQQQPSHRDSEKRLWPDPTPSMPSMYATASSHHGQDGGSFTTSSSQQHSRPSLGAWLATHPEERPRYSGVPASVPATSAPAENKQLNSGDSSDSWASSSQSPRDAAASSGSLLASQASVSSMSPSAALGDIVPTAGEAAAVIKLEGDSEQGQGRASEGHLEVAAQA
ncbi:HLH-domain-containing protein [Jaminaea rosea]|uniref:HLH-domain-containing protein n=1 Tax=Jaminaea rosea TaxID=1569628 RepID=A0A316US89_9BASI|nr:HLH-domain-containing protein [Jaminaea rosea]PWN27854.1 HLH-domain-containing protein [Jaminaea rosea]